MNVQVLMKLATSCFLVFLVLSGGCGCRGKDRPATATAPTTSGAWGPATRGVQGRIVQAKVIRNATPGYMSSVRVYLVVQLRNTTDRKMRLYMGPRTDWRGRMLVAPKVRCSIRGAEGKWWSLGGGILLPAEWSRRITLAPHGMTTIEFSSLTDTTSVRLFTDTDGSAVAVRAEVVIHTSRSEEIPWQDHVLETLPVQQSFPLIPEDDAYWGPLDARKE